MNIAEGKRGVSCGRQYQIWKNDWYCSGSGLCAYPWTDAFLWPRSVWGIIVRIMILWAARGVLYISRNGEKECDLGCRILPIFIRHWRERHTWEFILIHGLPRGMWPVWNWMWRRVRSLATWCRSAVWSLWWIRCIISDRLIRIIFYRKDVVMDFDMPKAVQECSFEVYCNKVTEDIVAEMSLWRNGTSCLLMARRCWISFLGVMTVLLSAVFNPATGSMADTTSLPHI